jgi:hypothetical protein
VGGASLPPRAAVSRYSHTTAERAGVQMKKEEKRSAKKTRFRPGSTGVCEAQLWTFTGPPKVPSDDAAPEVCRVAAESLDEALRYLRQRHHDLQIMEARCTGMVALLSGSPLD